MKQICEVAHPQVGKYYLVPCIDRPKVFGSHRFLPVVGPWHEDAETVNFPEYHFHYDWRFMPRSTIGPRSHARVATHKEFQDKFRKDGTPNPTPIATTLRRLKMKREMIEFPARIDGNVILFVKALEVQFKEHRLTCKTCPHRGMPLDNLPTDSNGNVVCNGHGLRWNLNTRKLAPRLI